MKIEQKKIQLSKKVCIIDGIEFDEPKTFSDYLSVGIMGICLIILSPLWIIPYLLGRGFKKISKSKTIHKEKILLRCPSCKLYLLRGDYYQVKCSSCGFYKYFEDGEGGAGE